MILLDHINASFEPDRHLGWDEALYALSEAEGLPPLLRLWRTVRPMIVIGRSNQAEKEVRMDVAQSDDIPVYRRSSGGGTVLLDNGCLNYALILPIPWNRQLQSVTGTNGYLMTTTRDALNASLGINLTIKGVTDLTLKGQKVCGNAQRRGRKALLFHGSILLSADLRAIERYLHEPTKKPDYRGDRTHRQFIANLEKAVKAVKDALVSAWKAEAVIDEPSLQKASQKAAEMTPKPLMPIPASKDSPGQVYL